MWRSAALLSALLFIAWDASAVAPRQLDLVWVGVVAALLVQARSGREWARMLLMTMLTTYATLIVLGNLRSPDVLARRGLPIAIAVTVVGYSLRWRMLATRGRRMA